MRGRAFLQVCDAESECGFYESVEKRLKKKTFEIRIHRKLFKISGDGQRV